MEERRMPVDQRGGPTTPEAGATSEPQGRRIPVGVVVLIAAALVILLGFSGSFGTGGGATRAPSVTVGGVYATPAPAGGSAALYFSVTNDGGADDLVGVTTPAAERTSLHRTTDQGGLVVMSETPDLAVPADGQLVLRPGGSHVMLDGLAAATVAGDRFEVTLEFERSMPKTVSVQVITPSQVAELVGTAG